MTQGVVRTRVTEQYRGIRWAADRRLQDPSLDLHSINAGEKQVFNRCHLALREQVVVKVCELTLIGAVHPGDEQFGRAIKIRNCIE